MFSNEKKLFFCKTCKLNAKLRVKFANVNAPLEPKIWVEHWKVDFGLPQKEETNMIESISDQHSSLFSLNYTEILSKKYSWSL